MENDDDFELFSPAELEAPSSQSRGRKLKRLKRAVEVASADPLIEHSKRDLPALDEPSSPDSGPTNSAGSNEQGVEEPSDPLLSSGAENAMEDDATGSGSLSVEFDRVKRVLAFDSVDEEIDVGEESGEGSEEPVNGKRFLEFDSVDEEIGLGEESGEGSKELVDVAPEERWNDPEQVTPGDTKRKNKKERRKSGNGIDGDNEQIETPAVANKRREEKVVFIWLDSSSFLFISLDEKF